MSSMLFALSFFLVAPAILTGRELNYPSEKQVHKTLDHGKEKLSTVLISGSVLCMACGSLGKTTPTTTYGEPVSGALVAVSCHVGRGKNIPNWFEGKTSEGGRFSIHLPSQLYVIPNLDKRCLIEIIGLPKSCLCRHSFTGKRVGMKLGSVDNGTRVYIANILRLMPKPSQKCAN
ncbi:uncharacterized protein LOC124933794 [Impatiens glandulifera]|uniref:uncharacterized protein LOC124933794 n=1 Tax=Impatiens glandulifera TaxID=253017 RepID=UPI001FB09F05|nr:uncharacterized protein LOC124933794 [Impatiens glandulifera]